MRPARMARGGRIATLAMFEELDRPLVFLGSAARLERAQVSPVAALGVNFSRVESILSGLQFADHGILLSCLHTLHFTLPVSLHVTFPCNR
jgi:hypothetical protein